MVAGPQQQSAATDEVARHRRHWDDGVLQPGLDRVERVEQRLGGELRGDTTGKNVRLDRHSSSFPFV